MKKKKQRKAKLQANSRLGKMNESGPGVGSAKVGSVRWEVASIEFDDGCELGARDHCKLARPSAKPIIRTQDERGDGAAASVRWRGGQLVWSVGS